MPAVFYHPPNNAKKYKDDFTTLFRTSLTGEWPLRRSSAGTTIQMRKAEQQGQVKTTLKTGFYEEEFHRFFSYFQLGLSKPYTYKSTGLDRWPLLEWEGHQRARPPPFLL
jgi:hypothetical protein